MVQISIDYDGKFHCNATHGPSGAPLATDAPLDNQGKGEAFSPTDLVATALGTCIATTMAIVAEPAKVATALKARFGGLVDRVLCTFSFVEAGERAKYLEELRAG